MDVKGELKSMCNEGLKVSLIGYGKKYFDFNQIIVYLSFYFVTIYSEGYTVSLLCGSEMVYEDHGIPGMRECNVRKVWLPGIA